MDKFKKRNISMPADVYKKVMELAEKERRSFSNMISLLCEQQIDAIDISSHPAVAETAKYVYTPNPDKNAPDALDEVNTSKKIR